MTLSTIKTYLENACLIERESQLWFHKAIVTLSAMCVIKHLFNEIICYIKLQNHKNDITVIVKPYRATLLRLLAPDKTLTMTLTSLLSVLSLNRS